MIKYILFIYFLIIFCNFFTLTSEFPERIRDSYTNWAKALLKRNPVLVSFPSLSH